MNAITKYQQFIMQRLASGYTIRAESVIGTARMYTPDGVMAVRGANYQTMTSLQKRGLVCYDGDKRQWVLTP